MSIESYPPKESGLWHSCFSSTIQSAIASQQLLLKAILANSTIGLVKISANNHINTLKISSKHPNPKTVVFSHGFGAGLGFFHRNYLGLSEQLSASHTIYSIDWLGMANSSRPKFPQWDKTKDDLENVVLAEEFFIDSLEEWREKVGLERFTLVGHSLGGYLSTRYADKFPSRVEKLILVSPAGVGKMSSEAKAELDKRRQSSWMWSLVGRIWDNNITPQSLIRYSGPFGNSFVKGYTNRRFSHLEEEDKKVFHDYFYNITAQKGSGEYAFGTLLVPGAYARIPLHDRLKELPGSMATSYLYGSNDWMDYKMALVARRDEKDRVVRVSDAGHHLYSDQPDAFNLAVCREILGHEGVNGSGLEYL